MVVQHSRGGAYLLRDTTNDLLTNKVPASQLRLISYEGGLFPDSFDVDHIVDHKGEGANLSYLVRWKGFDPEYDSWVSHEDVNTLACIAEYWDKRREVVNPVGSRVRPRANLERPPSNPKARRARRKRARLS